MIDTDFEREGREFEQNCLYAAAIARLEQRIADLETSVAVHKRLTEYLCDYTGFDYDYEYLKAWNAVARAAIRARDVKADARQPEEGSQSPAKPAKDFKLVAKPVGVHLVEPCGFNIAEHIKA